MPAVHEGTGCPCTARNCSTSRHSTSWTQYQSVYRGLVNFYRMAHNLRDVRRASRSHAAVADEDTGCQVPASACREVYRRYRTQIRNDEGALRSVLEVRVEREGKPPFIARWGGISLAWGIATTLEDRLRSVSIRSTDGIGATTARGHLRILRQPGTDPSASHSRAERPEAEGTIGQAAVGQADGGAASQDAGALSSVPRGPPRWQAATVVWSIRHWRAG